MLADRRACSCARDVRAAAPGVDDALAVPRQDRLAPQHVALLPTLRMVVVHGQRAQDRHGILCAMAHVRGLADEVLLFDPGGGHARLDHVVFGLELVAMGAIGLLQPASRAVHADPAGDQPVRPARFPQRVPKLQPLLDRNVHLPAQVPDVGDARSQHALRADLDHAASAELETFVRHVVRGGARHDVARAGTPQADGRHRRGHVG